MMGDLETTLLCPQQAERLFVVRTLTGGPDSDPQLAVWHRSEPPVPSAPGSWGSSWCWDDCVLNEITSLWFTREQAEQLVEYLDRHCPARFDHRIVPVEHPIVIRYCLQIASVPKHACQVDLHAEEDWTLPFKVSGAIKTESCSVEEEEDDFADGMSRREGPTPDFD